VIYLLGLFFYIGQLSGNTMFCEGFPFCIFFRLANDIHTIGLASVIPFAFDHYVY
jgi:hypothetical protein